MPVNTPCAAYNEMLPLWTRIRDCRSGGDAVKARGELYLPKLGSHKGPNGQALYDAYKLRALFYNATGRTIDGLSGAIYQKAPVVKVPKAIEEHVKNITLSGISLDMYSLRSNREILTTGRDGILIDMPAVESTQARPYWVSYRAEDIIAWDSDRSQGAEVLTLVMLRETYKEQDPKDRWVKQSCQQYRVLELAGGTGGVYTQTIYRRVRDTEVWEPYAEGGLDAQIAPTRRKKTLDFIPFVFIGPTSVSPDLERPPLVDLADVNLSQYRTSAGLENALYWVGMPVLALTGWNTDDDIKYGSSSALLIPNGGDAKILQADGEMCGALERAHDRKKEQMATLGARLLEAPTIQAETATAVSMRHSGEHATLRTIAQSQEQGLTLALQIHAWWVGMEAVPADVEVSVELNKEFFNRRMTAEDIKALVLAYQAETISWETFYAGLQGGGWAREGVDAQAEQKAIQQQVVARPAVEPGAKPNPNDPLPPHGGALPPDPAVPAEEGAAA